MALVLHLKYAENLRGRADRLAKVSFRGESKILNEMLNISGYLWWKMIQDIDVTYKVGGDGGGGVV